MMNRIILALLCAFVTTSSVFAQGKAKPPAKNKIVIGIAPLEFSPTFQDAAVQLHDIITHAFSSNKDIELLDRATVLQIEKELKLQKGKNYSASKTVKRKASHGAQWLVLGNLTDITLEQNTLKLSVGKSGISNSQVTVHFSLEVVDVATGEMKHHEIFAVENAAPPGENPQARNHNTVSNNKKAILAKVEEWVNTIFPPTFSIASVDKKDKDGNPLVISIVIDQKQSVRPDYIININEVTTVNVAGSDRTKVVKIAALMVKELQGDFVQCEVLEGEEALKTRLEKGTEGLRLELTSKKVSMIKKLKRKTEGDRSR